MFFNFTSTCSTHPYKILENLGHNTLISFSPHSLDTHLYLDDCKTLPMPYTLCVTTFLPPIPYTFPSSYPFLPFSTRHELFKYTICLLKLNSILHH